MSEPVFVEVYAKATGRKQEVPAHYMDDPILSEPFRKTPLSEQQAKKAEAAIAKATKDNEPGDPVPSTEI